MEGGIRLSMAPPIESMSTGGHAARGGDRTGAAECGEGGFRANPLGIVPEDNQQGGRGVGADGEALAEGGRRLGGESLEVPVRRRNFAGEGQPATGKGPECVLPGGDGGVEWTRSKSCAARDGARSGSACRGSRSTGGTLMMICLSVFIAVVRALTAVSRATLS